MCLQRVVERTAAISCFAQTVCSFLMIPMTSRQMSPNLCESLTQKSGSDCFG